jgi:hypothetical protein
MALKIEHKCTRCGKTVAEEVQDVKAASAVDEEDKKREAVLTDIHEFFAGIDPELLPDLYVVRRGKPPVVQTFLCNEEDAKRACAERVDVLVDECQTFDPRKPKTKKADKAEKPAATK